MSLPVSPLQGRYTRQQIADATGIERELLAYWIKEGLLIAAQGEGRGKGKRRLFGFEAIHIAAVLTGLGRYGVQTAGFKQIASLLWRIVALGSDHPDITETIALDASALRKVRARYPARASRAPGDEVSTLDYSCFEDWLEDHPSLSGKAFKMEPWFDDAAELGFALYHELFTLSIFERLEARWMFFHADDELIAVPEYVAKGLVNLDRTPSYLIINLSLRGPGDAPTSSRPSPQRTWRNLWLSHPISHEVLNNSPHTRRTFSVGARPWQSSVCQRSRLVPA